MIAFSLPNAAHALNGYVNVATCPGCLTSTDFKNAAITQARSVKASGTYQLSSTAAAETAYVQVIGQMVNVGDGDQRPVWRFQIVSATLLDSNGNSLEGQPESTLQAFFAALDVNTMGASRNNPTITIGLPLPSFLGADDYQISAAWFNISVNNASDLDSGTVVTISWNDGSGIVAVYTVVWLADDHTNVKNFALRFKSATKNGKPIDRNGNPIPNPNNSGSGSGSVSVVAFGAQGAGIGFSISGAGACFSSITLTLNGNPWGYWGGVIPC